MRFTSPSMHHIRLAAMLMAAAPVIASCAHPTVEPPREKPALSDMSNPDDLVRDPDRIADAQKALDDLGYDAGTVDSQFGARSVKALRAFQRDQMLQDDGKLTIRMAERVAAVRAKVFEPRQPMLDVGATFYYTDGSRETVESKVNGMVLWQAGDGTHRQASESFFVTVEPGFTTDAKADFLRPLRPGGSGSYRILTRNDEGKLIPQATVTCGVGHIVRTNVPAGTYDALDVSCRETAADGAVTKRRWWYANELGVPVRADKEDVKGVVTSVELVAMRPGTEGWPQAARTGFDWAITHALDTRTPQVPVQWSSTGVKSQYTIRIDPKLSVPLGSVVSPEPVTVCRRYEILRGDDPTPHKRFPGLACKTAMGQWIVPAHRPYIFESPNAGSDPAALPTLSPPKG